MADEDLLVILRAPHDQSGHQRSPDTAANVAHEIDYSGDAVAFLRRDSDVTCRGDGDEKKSDSHYLRDAQPHCKTSVSGVDADWQAHEGKRLEHV